VSVQLRKWRAHPNCRQATKEDLLDACDVLATLTKGTVTRYSERSTCQQLRREMRNLLAAIEIDISIARGMERALR